MLNGLLAKIESIGKEQGIAPQRQQQPVTAQVDNAQAHAGMRARAAELARFVR